MDIITEQMQVDRKTLLACAWTTEEESRRYRTHPWVVSGDVVEGLNNEKRPFMMLLNYDDNNESNVNTNIFVPSCQRWDFEWATGIALTILHGKETVLRTQILLFDQAPNEFGPFENHTNALMRLCWYHCGTQKTIPFKKLVSNDDGKRALNDAG